MKQTEEHKKRKLQIGDLVALLPGPNWLQGIMVSSDKKGIVIAHEHAGFHRNYLVKWFDGSDQWVYARDVEVLSKCVDNCLTNND